MTTANKARWILFLSIAVLLLIIVFQNLADIELRLLFWKASLPQAVVLAITVLIGFLMGLFARTLWKVRAWRIRGKSRKESAADA